MCSVAAISWLSHACKPLEVANDDLPPADANEACAFPCAQDTAHRVQCRSRDLGDVLMRNRKIDKNPVVNLASGLLYQSEDSVRDAPRDLLGRHLLDSGMGLSLALFNVAIDSKFVDVTLSA